LMPQRRRSPSSKITPNAATSKGFTYIRQSPSSAGYPKRSAVGRVSA
jgi:hypothetical protein